MQSNPTVISADKFLIDAGRAARLAAKKCRLWEKGGPSEPVGDTADSALSAIERAITASQCEDDIVLVYKDPGTRRARIILAGYMMLLAGTDEHGESADLEVAASLFRRAAIA